MAKQTGLTWQQAVEALAYDHPEGKAFIQRQPSMSNGPRWKWMGGKLVLFKDMVDGPHPLLPCLSQEAYTSQDWALFTN
ncbi:hypothetical protein FY034_18025 (plasmid) [Trichlorobacter lovleyi]|uniref:hypothetical protein n=1 Tax=Trichlorobacter lovleyi TaxID=313985 RepID=UPI00223EE3B6|nr:hypothetical protein [Trichlorobacter lovleyi]QOX80899.1 hypothetical protein FY034_18025 [Trichlorobacter lovleyi]